MKTIDKRLSYEEAKIQILQDGLRLLGAPAHLLEKAASVTRKTLLGEAEVFSGLEEEDIFRLEALVETLRERKLDEVLEVSDPEPSSISPFKGWPLGVSVDIRDVAWLLRESPGAELLYQELKDVGTEVGNLLSFLEIRAGRALTTEAEVAKASGLTKKQAAELLELALADRLREKLGTALENGAKYQELLEITEGYSLSQEMKQKVLNNAIYICFLTDNALFSSPRPKQIAAELGAPQQLILQIYLQGWEL